MITAVKDEPKTSSKECLKCFEKHLGEGIVLLGEISDRFSGKLDPDETHVKEDISDAMKQLGAAERHVQQVTSTVDPQKIATLKSYGAEARALRGALRSLREEYSSLSPEERLAKVNTFQLRAKQLDTQVRTSLDKEPCTTCQKINADYLAVLHQKVDVVQPTTTATVTQPPVKAPKESLKDRMDKTLPTPVLEMKAQVEKEVLYPFRMAVSDFWYLLTGIDSNE